MRSPGLPWADETAALALLLADDGEPQDWRDSAACAEVDPDLHFPEKGGSTKDAKRVCMGCEVRAECLEYALANPDLAQFGIWGGKSVQQRRDLRRQQEAA